MEYGSDHNWDSGDRESEYYRERINLLLFVKGVGIVVMIHGVSDSLAFVPKILERENEERERERSEQWLSSG